MVSGLGKQRTEMRSKGRHDHQSSTARDQLPLVRPHVPEIPHITKPSLAGMKYLTIGAYRYFTSALKHLLKNVAEVG